MCRLPGKLKEIADEYLGSMLASEKRTYQGEQTKPKETRVGYWDEVGGSLHFYSSLLPVQRNYLPEQSCVSWILKLLFGRDSD